MAEFLINERSRALLDLVDAFKLSESELRDVWDGIFNRISEIAEVENKKMDEAWKELDPFDDKGRLFRKIGFDDPMMYACDMCKGSGYIESTDDTEDWECPKCGGSGVLSEDYVVSQELKDKEDDVEELVDSDEFEELMEGYIAKVEEKGGIPL